MYQHHSLIAAIKTKNNPVGVLLLTRSDHDSKFTAKEEKCFNELLPFIINGLSYKDEDKPQIADSGEAGIIIFNQEAKLLHLSEQARVLLFRATHPGELAVKPDGFKVPQGVKQLVKNLVALFKSKGLDVSPPVWRQQSAWGEFDFRAQWLGSYEQNSDSLIAVTIQYREPIKLKIWRICEEFKLTNKQAEVTMLVVEGYTYEAIAERMAISKYTVIDYVKILFEKFDVKNRNQLVSKIAWLK